MDHAHFPWRPLGTLLAEKGLVTEAELEHALAEQRRSGRLLGQILVARGYVSALTLARALAEQHGVELQPAGTSETRAAADPGRSFSTRRVSPTKAEDGAWRPLGKLLIEMGFVSEAELDEALAEQAEHPERRLGAILVARGHLSGPALALTLADQHGVELAAEEPLEEELETVITPAAPGQPTYRVHEVAYEPTYRPGAILYESANFLEAADFACDYVARRKPAALEIQKTDGRARETVWTYSESRAAAEAASRSGLVGTFGFDPVRWDTRGQFDPGTKQP